jgi:uroporphyrinogen decarboxylase
MVRGYPLDDWAKLDRYAFPPLPAYVTDPAENERAAQNIKKHKESYFYKTGWYSLFDQLQFLRPETDLFCDMAEGDPRVSRLLDKLTDYYARRIRADIQTGVDGIVFGDDFGTQESLIISREMFAEYFKPRYAHLIKPIREAGVKVHFHCCGKAEALLSDFKDMGVDSIWPQLPAYNMRRLADTCRDLQMAVALHTDRAHTMTYGSPESVKNQVIKAYEAFRPDRGGSWFFIEIDNGFPFANIRALFETIYNLRG